MKNKVIVISSYPERSKIHGEETVGGASYTKNLLMNLKKADKNIDIEVLGEIHKKKTKYQEQGILVNRIWKRHSIISLIDLMLYVAKSKTSKVMISLEFYMFGGLLENILFLFMLLVFKFTRKKNIVILHQVVGQLKIVYWPIILLSDKIVVFEEHFRSALDNEKVIFIPHAVVNANTLSKKHKNFRALYFGYLSLYKGVDFLIDSWKKNYGELVIAGGANPNHMKNKKYSNFIQRLAEKAKRKGVAVTGFVPEKQISNYFSNSDLVILPYKMFFSSSGPLSLAFSYEKPFIISRQMEGYFKSRDFDKALMQTGLKKENFLFDLNENDFVEKLTWAKKNLNKLTDFSRIMKTKRSWERIVKEYEKLLQ